MTLLGGDGVGNGSNEETEPKEKPMSKMIKTLLVALSILAGASVGYAANNDTGGRNNDGRGMMMDRNDGPDLQERQKLVDPDTTGSIQTCDSQSYDEFGNCIVTPDMQ